MLRLAASVLDLCHSNNFTTKANESIFRASITLQDDGGTNHLVTDDKDILSTYCDIPDYWISGIGSGIKYTGKGMFPLVCDDESIILITIMYSEEALAIVISTIDMVM